MSILRGRRARKRPKIEAASLEALVAHAGVAGDKYESSGADRDLVTEDDGMRDGRTHDLFAKGQSKRIWGELYKVIDCSDVVLMVLDARNVPGTRCHHLEHHLKKNCPHKHLVCTLSCIPKPGQALVFYSLDPYTSWHTMMYGSCPWCQSDTGVRAE